MLCNIQLNQSNIHKIPITYPLQINKSIIDTSSSMFKYDNRIYVCLLFNYNSQAGFEFFLNNFSKLMYNQLKFYCSIIASLDYFQKV